MRVLVAGGLGLHPPLGPVGDEPTEVVFADDGEDTIRQAGVLQPDVVILEETMSGYAQWLSGSCGVIILRQLDRQDDVVRAMLATATTFAPPFVPGTNDLAGN